MKRKKNKIVIRTDLIMSLYFFVCIIILEFLLEQTYITFRIIISVGWIIMAILAYLPKVTLHLEKINEGFLTIDNGTCKKDFVITHLRYDILYNILVLTDGKSTIYMKKNRKLIRELKKLGAKKEELE